MSLENTEPKAVVSKPLTFEERIAYRIADIVVERVVEGLSSKFGGVSKLTLHELPGCRLVGLRLSQFERFCEIMRESPAKRLPEGQQLYFLNTKNCLIFASAEGDDSERMRGCGGERE
jgi:hypothetical protein